VDHLRSRYPAQVASTAPAVRTQADEPLHHVLRARLREIVAGARPGDRLPSERSLSQRWHVARMTVRNATDALVAEGLVERRQGSGTYVLPQPVVRFLGLTSFTQDMRERGLVPSSRLLAFDVVDADATVAGPLRIAVGDEVVRFTRLRLGSGEPMAVETTWIAATLVPGLAPPDLDGSLYELLAHRYRIVPGSASVTIEPMVPDPTTRRHLGIAPRQACLRLRMTDSDTRGRVIMIADCVYRGDRYQLSASVPSAVASSLQRRRLA
jgi:GntR family transcriptional regulator